MKNEYHFKTVWRIPGSASEIAHVIADGTDIKRWWPSVYLKAVELEEGDPSGVGKVVQLHTKGWLPYTLLWKFKVIEVEYERRIVVEASGDFVGKGVWTFEQDGETAIVSYDWRILAEKPLLRRLSPVLRPLFAANHLWAMRVGERSLLLELQRRHATTSEEAAAIPPPPQPVPSWPVYTLLGAVGALTLLKLLLHLDKVSDATDHTRAVDLTL